MSFDDTTAPQMRPVHDAEVADTRRRLLDAAGEVFARRGFRDATVREICGLANANLAAVNYHFGDKAALYRAVISETSREMTEHYPPLMGIAPDAPADARLHAFVRSMMLRMFQPGRAAWFGNVMAREMIEPTEVLDSLVGDTIRPMYQMLMGIVSELLGPGADEDQIRLSAGSVIGQCVHYKHCRSMICRLVGEDLYQPDRIEQIARHITTFSLAAMKTLREERGGR